MVICWEACLLISFKGTWGSVRELGKHPSGRQSPAPWGLTGKWEESNFSPWDWEEGVRSFVHWPLIYLYCPTGGHMDPAVCGLAEHPAAKTQLLEWVGGGNHLRFRGLRENLQRKKNLKARKTITPENHFRLQNHFRIISLHSQRSRRNFQR